MRLLTFANVCEILGLGRSALYERIADGRLACVRDGRLVRFTQDQVEAYVEKHRTDRKRTRPTRRTPPPALASSDRADIKRRLGIVK